MVRPNRPTGSPAPVRCSGGVPYSRIAARPDSDGLSAEARAPKGRSFDLMNAHPLLIGRGAQGSFAGAIADVRLYNRALTPRSVAAIAAGGD